MGCSLEGTGNKSWLGDPRGKLLQLCTVLLTIYPFVESRMQVRGSLFYRLLYLAAALDQKGSTILLVD